MTTLMSDTSFLYFCLAPYKLASMHYYLSCASIACRPEQSIFMTYTFCCHFLLLATSNYLSPSQMSSAFCLCLAPSTAMSIICLVSSPVTCAFEPLCIAPLKSHVYPTTAKVFSLVLAPSKPCVLIVLLLCLAPLPWHVVLHL